MTILFNGNRFKYEMENVARLFFPLQHFQFQYDTTEFPSDDFLAFFREEYETEAELTVTVRQGDYFRQEKSRVSLSVAEYENECEAEFARMLYRILEELTGVHPRWGILTGIRPVHRIQHGLDSGKSRREINEEFSSRFYVSEEKIRLSNLIFDQQAPVIESISPKDFSLYVSIPYCPSRCSYCSFVSHSITQQKAKKLIPEYLNYLVKEINFTSEIARDCGLRLRSIYIGGGTPTVLEPEQLAQITDCVKNAFTLIPEVEYTIEAGRADTITQQKLDVIRNAGAGRISINPQTFEDGVLRAVGRNHTANQVVECYEMARATGFDCINMDLIAGLPTDTPDGFARSLQRAIFLQPENITVHALSVKRAADLYATMDGSEDYRAVQQMVDFSGNELPQNGYLPYYLYRQKNTLGNLENVGYAKPGYIGLYNIFIMEEVQHILAVGAGAVSKVVRPGRIDRFFNFKYPYEYISGFSDILERKNALRNLLKEV